MSVALTREREKSRVASIPPVPAISPDCSGRLPTTAWDEISKGIVRALESAGVPHETTGFATPFKVEETPES